MAEFQVPAHILTRRSSASLATLSMLANSAVPYLSIKANRFVRIDAVGNEKPVVTADPKTGMPFVDVIVADANEHMSKVYYADAFDPSATEYKAPDCWSDNGIGPSSQSAHPQNPTCSSCPRNAWGSEVSRITGKPTKACNDIKKLALVMPDDPGMVFMLRIPPASLKNLGAYAKQVASYQAGDRSVEISDLVTRISFDPKAVGVLVFSPVGWTSPEIYDKIDRMLEKRETDAVVGRNDKPMAADQMQQISSERAAPPAQIAPPPQPPKDTMPPVQQWQPDGPVTPPPAFVSQQASAQQVAAEAEETKRKRRTKAEMEAARAAEQPAAKPAPADDVLEIPAFLQKRGGQAEVFTPPAPQPVQTTTRFGMSEPAAPNEDLMAALDRAFALPTG